MQTTVVKPPRAAAAAPVPMAAVFAEEVGGLFLFPFVGQI
jgi:hypothetical protein